jgi:hypothetical protein
MNDTHILKGERRSADVVGNIVKLMRLAMREENDPRSRLRGIGARIRL